MEKVSISRLLKIISAENMERLNPNPRSYDPKKDYRGRGDNRTNQGDYQSRYDRQHKSLNKLGNK